jgi:hypothetical protein
MVEKEMRGQIYSDDGIRINANGEGWCPVVRFDISGVGT